MVGLAFIYAQPIVRVVHTVKKCVNPTNVFFLLSRWYAEDCERLRLLQPLKNLRGHPIDILVGLILRPQRLITSSIYPQVHTEGDLLDYRPDVMQEEKEWEANTQLPYDPFVSCVVLKDHCFDCPSCGHSVVARKLASSHVAYRPSPHPTKHTYPIPEARDMPKGASS